MQILARRSLFFAVFLIVVVATAPAWQWPVDDPRVKTTFGQSADRVFFPGVRVTGADTSVRPVETGEVVFANTGGPRATSLPSSIGKYAVVEHDDSFRSVYANLDESDSTPVGRVTPATVLGRYVSDDAYDGVILIIEDGRRRNRVNPFIVLPRLPGGIAPVIRDVVAHANGTEYAVVNRATIPSGEREFSVVTFEPVSGVPDGRVAPYRLRTSIGERTREIVFDTLVVRDGELLMSGESSHTDLYRDERTVLGSFDVGTGNVSVEIMVAGFSGVSRSVRIVVGGSATE